MKQSLNIAIESCIYTCAFLHAVTHATVSWTRVHLLSRDLMLATCFSALADDDVEHAVVRARACALTKSNCLTEEWGVTSTFCIGETPSPTDGGCSGLWRDAAQRRDPKGKRSCTLKKHKLLRMATGYSSTVLFPRKKIHGHMCVCVCMIHPPSTSRSGQSLRPCRSSNQQH